jgi:phage gpG-like protein
MIIQIKATTDKGMRRLEKMRSKMNNLKPAMEGFKTDVIRMVKDNIGQQGFYFGTFRPLAPSTVRQRGSKRPILIRSGRMVRSFTGKADKNSMTLQNKTEYAKYHQSGTRKMPQRKLIEVNDRVSALMKTHIIKYFQDLLR